MATTDTDAQAEVTRTSAAFSRIAHSFEDHLSAVRQQIDKIDLSGLYSLGRELSDSADAHETARGAMNNPDGNAPGDAPVVGRDDDGKDTKDTGSKTAAKSS